MLSTTLMDLHGGQHNNGSVNKMFPDVHFMYKHTSHGMALAFEDVETSQKTNVKTTLNDFYRCITIKKTVHIVFFFFVPKIPMIITSNNRILCTVIIPLNWTDVTGTHADSSRHYYEAHVIEMLFR